MTTPVARIQGLSYIEQLPAEIADEGNTHREKCHLTCNLLKRVKHWLNKRAMRCVRNWQYHALRLAHSLCDTCSRDALHNQMDYLCSPRDDSILWSIQSSNSHILCKRF